MMGEPIAKKVYKQEQEAFDADINIIKIEADKARNGSKRSYWGREDNPCSDVIAF